MGNTCRFFLNENTHTGRERKEERERERIHALRHTLFNSCTDGKLVRLITSAALDHNLNPVRSSANAKERERESAEAVPLHWISFLLGTKGGHTNIGVRPLLCTNILTPKVMLDYNQDTNTRLDISLCQRNESNENRECQSPRSRSNTTYSSGTAHESGSKHTPSPQRSSTTD